MRVQKRNGQFEDVKFDKVTARIENLADGLDVDPTILAQKVLVSITDGIKTSDIDEITADIAASIPTGDYSILAARIIASNLHKNCPSTFVEAMNKFYPDGVPYPSAISKVRVCPERDNLIDFFGLKTLIKMYLTKDIETPQYMFMRVALAICSGDPVSAQETYDAMSLKYYIHATPTLFNAGTTNQQLSSCFLAAMKDDSIEGIYDTKKECALISRMAGGIGMHIHNIRAKGSKIHGTNGKSDGIIPMLRTLNADARYVNQAGRRKGSYAVYLEPWHADIMPFLDLKLNQGDEEARCRDLFPALWIPDLFMKRLEKNEDWSLFCPNEAPGLSDVYGDEFEQLYERYEREGRARAKMPIQKIWLAILKSQVETGSPYMLYKDACNRKSNQKNIGTIKSSNLCVAPETFIRTRNGDHIIANLENQEVEVWNGHEWSMVTVRKTSNSARLIDVRVRIETVDGKTFKTLTCTPEHKFIVPGGGRVDAQSLCIGKELQEWVDNNGIHNKAFVVSVTDGNRVSATYCFTEPIRNAGMFNGILTGQCTEIIEHSDSDHTAVCNLASIGLPTYVNGTEFDYKKLEEVTRLVVRNLNKVIDVTHYPVETAKRSNMKLRPIGIGVQGLADVYAMLKMEFGSGTLNRDIFETIYYAAVSESIRLAQLLGPYDGFKGSPASEGIFQFDMWGVTPSDRYDWESLRKDMVKYGLRNSLLIAPMPTATTSQILGFNECFEPFTTNIYLRRTLAGEFVVVNKYLVRDLKELGLWTPGIRTKIIKDSGSIADIQEIPEDLRKIYRTAWEISSRVIIDMAKERGAYICQSQSMNLFVEAPTNAKLSSIHMYAWKSGLKTGMYYLRTRPKARAIQFTIEPTCVMCSA